MCAVTGWGSRTAWVTSPLGPRHRGPRGLSLGLAPRVAAGGPGSCHPHIPLVSITSLALTPLGSLIALPGAVCRPVHDAQPPGLPFEIWVEAAVIPQAVASACLQSRRLVWTMPGSAASPPGAQFSTRCRPRRNESWRNTLLGGSRPAGNLACSVPTASSTWVSFSHPGLRCPQGIFPVVNAKYLSSL